jgi:hypothetical protein
MIHNFLFYIVVTTLQPEPTLSAYAFIQHMLQQIDQITNTLKPQLDQIRLRNEVSGILLKL